MLKDEITLERGDQAAAWGQFYVKLHTLAESVRQRQKETAAAGTIRQDEPAATATNQMTEVTRPIDSSRRREISKTGG